MQLHGVPHLLHKVCLRVWVLAIMIAMEDKAACNMDCIRYQLKKAQGPKLHSDTVIAQFEDIATEINEADERGSSPLSRGHPLLKPPRKNTGV